MGAQPPAEPPPNASLGSLSFSGTQSQGMYWKHLLIFSFPCYSLCPSFPFHPLTTAPCASCLSPPVCNWAEGDGAGTAALLLSTLCSLLLQTSVELSAQCPGGSTGKESTHLTLHEHSVMSQQGDDNSWLLGSALLRVISCLHLSHHRLWAAQGHLQRVLRLRMQQKG